MGSDLGSYGNFLLYWYKMILRAEEILLRDVKEIS